MYYNFIAVQPHSLPEVPLHLRATPCAELHNCLVNLNWISVDKYTCILLSKMLGYKRHCHQWGSTLEGLPHEQKRFVLSSFHHIFDGILKASSLVQPPALQNFQIHSEVLQMLLPTI
jgi:hypothetical protein